MGHNIFVNLGSDRLSVPTTQLARISKLLLSMEKRQVSGMQEKSLDEMGIEGLYRN